jgi:hypothetical protein
MSTPEAGKNEWVRRSPEYHIGRAKEHLRLLREGDRRTGGARCRQEGMATRCCGCGTRRAGNVP